MAASNGRRPCAPTESGHNRQRLRCVTRVDLDGNGTPGLTPLHRYDRSNSMAERSMRPMTPIGRIGRSVRRTTDQHALTTPRRPRYRSRSVRVANPATLEPVPTIRVTVDGRPVLTIEQAAARVGVAESTIRAAMHRHRLVPVAKLGRMPLFTAKALDAAFTRKSMES